MNIMKMKNNCNYNYNLKFVLLLIFLIIIILYFYKTKTPLDTNLNKNNNETIVIENFGATQDLIDQQTIIDNNKKINNLLHQLNNSQIVYDNSDAINKNFINNISSNIQTQVTNMSSYFNTSNPSNNITTLENKLTDLENMIINMNLNKVKTKEYSRIKSFNNGMDMELVKTPNTHFTDLKNGSNTAAYLLMMNKGCLSVGANDYDVYKCNDKNPKQYFKMQHILNETDYINNIDLSLPPNSDDLSTIAYPFAMIKSVNNDNCLTNNHGEITVQPCYSFVAQRWMPLE